MIWIVVAVYAALLALLAARSRRHSSADQFLMADRNASAVQVAAGLFTLIGGGEFVALTSLGFLFGWSGIALFLGYSLGFMFLGAVAPTLRADSREHRFVSLPDYVHFHFGPASGLFVFIFSVLAFFSLLMLQFSAAGAVIAPFLGVSEGPIIIFVGLAVVLYLVIGGLKAVLTTDVVQGAAMMLILPIIVFLVVQHVGAEAVVWEGSEGSLPLALWASLLFTGFFVAGASADVWQRAYAAESDRTAALGFYTGSVAFILYGVFIVSIGMIARAAGVGEPDNAFVAAMTTGLPEGVSALVALLVLCAMMSTADTEMFLLAGLVQRESSRFFPGSATARFFGTIGGLQVLILAVGILSILFAYFYNNLVQIYSWLLSALVVISPIVTFSLFKKASPTGMFLSLLGNTVVFSLLVGSGYMDLDNLYLIALPGALLYGVAILRAASQRGATEEV